MKSKKKYEYTIEEERLSDGQQMGWRVEGPFGTGMGIRRDVDLSIKIGEDILDQLLSKQELLDKRQNQLWKVDEILSVARRLLSKQQLQCFYLHFYRQLGPMEIGRTLNIHQPQVTAAIMTGISKLRKFFKVKSTKRYKYGQV